VKQAGKIDGDDSEPARPKPKVAKKQKKRKSMKSISTFGDEWSELPSSILKKFRSC
jgi:hypothetical protein